MMTSKFITTVLPILALLFLLFESTATAQDAKINTRYKDSTMPMNARIRILMDQMTLAEKLGQMAQIDRRAATPEIMRDYSLGSLLSGGGSVPKPQATPADWIEMINAFQNGSLSSRLGIPMIYGIDVEHGFSCCRDPELVMRIGAATALEARATGIPYVFAPCIAV